MHRRSPSMDYDNYMTDLMFMDILYSTWISTRLNILTWIKFTGNRFRNSNRCEVEQTQRKMDVLKWTFLSDRFHLNYDCTWDLKYSSATVFNLSSNVCREDMLHYCATIFLMVLDLFSHLRDKLWERDFSSIFTSPLQYGLPPLTTSFSSSFLQ